MSREFRNAIYDIRGIPAIHDPRTGDIVRAAVPGMAGRLEIVEKELMPNSGGSVRDVLDDVHRIASDNADRHDLVLSKANAAVALSGEAAQVAARTEQNLRELRDELSQDHADNTARLDLLEESAARAAIERRVFLNVLREQHGIDLAGELHTVLFDCEHCEDGDCDHCEGYDGGWCPHRCHWLLDDTPPEDS